MFRGDKTKAAAYPADRGAYLKYFAALLLFGSNGIIASSIHLASCRIVLYRIVLGSLLLLVTAGKTQALRGAAKHRKDLLFVCLSGMCMGISWLFQYEAYERIGISITSLVYCLGPVLVIILAQFVFREKITARKILCLAAVISGLLLINGVSLKQGAGMTGIICALMCAAAYAGMIIFNKKSLLITGLANSALQLTAGAVTVLIFNIIRQISSPGMLSFPAQRAEWLPILVLGLVNTGAGCYLYFSGISSIPAQTVAVCDYIEPLTALILAAVILRESLSPPQIAGAALILGGTLVWNSRLTINPSTNIIS